MVFFTCNSCGQSIKKAHVEKHYMTECRNCEVLSCIDCGKDFVGDDYKHHTKCISENEKYGGKDYMATAKLNKGEVKQTKWLECVQAASLSQSVNPRVRGLLNRLADYGNIPRKKAKFERFVQNSLKVWDSSLIEQIWNAFSTAANTQPTQPEQKATEEKQKENGESSEEIPEDQSTMHKKKRKHGEQEKTGAKDDRQAQGGPTDVEACDSNEDGQGAPRKKKKKRKHDRDPGTEESKATIERQEEAELPKKKTKRKRDKNQDDGVSNVETKGTNREGTSSCATADDLALPKKEKKAKHKKHHTDQTEDVENVKEVVEGDSTLAGELELDTESSKSSKAPKKKSKKKKQQDSGGTGSIEDGLLHRSTTETAPRKSGDKVNREVDTGLGKKKAKSKEQVVHQPESVKKKKSSGKSTTVDDSVMDGLLLVHHTDETKIKKNKSIELKEGNSDESIQPLNEKKKKKKPTAEDTITGQGQELSEKISEKKTNDANKKSDLKHDSKSERKKSKRKNSCHRDDSSLTGLQNEKKRKKQEDGGSEEIPPLKKKKSKSMNGESKPNGGIEGKRHKKKKQNSKDKN